MLSQDNHASTGSFGSQSCVNHRLPSLPVSTFSHSFFFPSTKFPIQSKVHRTFEEHLQVRFTGSRALVPTVKETRGTRGGGVRLALLPHILAGSRARCAGILVCPTNYVAFRGFTKEQYWPVEWMQLHDVATNSMSTDGSILLPCPKIVLPGLSFKAGSRCLWTPLTNRSSSPLVAEASPSEPLLLKRIARSLSRNNSR